MDQPLDPRLDIGLDAFGPLVVGDRAQHFLQAIEALASRAKGPSALLYPDVEIGEYRSKSVQLSANAVACAANGQ